MPRLADLKRYVRDAARVSTLVTLTLGGCTVHHMITDSRVTEIIAHTSLMCIVTSSCAVSAAVWYICENYTVGMDMVVGVGGGGGGGGQEQGPMDGVAASEDAKKKAAVSAMNIVMRNTVHRDGEEDQCLICFDDPRSALHVDILPVEGESRVRVDIRTVPFFRCPRCRLSMHTKCVTEMILIGGRVSCPICTYAFVSPPAPSP